MSADFVAAMENVLDLYAEPYDPKRPVVCFDETSTQLLADLRPSIPAAPGRPRREDYEYLRAGTRNLFLTCQPRRSWWPLTCLNSPRKEKCQWPPSGCTRQPWPQSTAPPATRTPTLHEGVKRVVGGIARSRGKAQRQAKPLTAEGPGRGESHSHRPEAPGRHGEAPRVPEPGASAAA